MPNTPQSFIIDPGGVEVAVDIHDAAGGVVTVYSARNGSTPVSLPVTISTPTTFWFTSGQVARELSGTPYVVSAKFSGVEVAGPNGTTATVEAHNWAATTFVVNLANGGLELANLLDAAGGGGSGLPPQWTDGGHGNVTATTDDDASALTVEAFAGQAAPLLVLKDENGSTVLSVSSEPAVTDDVWTVDGIAGAAIDADAGHYILSSDRMDSSYNNVIQINVGDNQATIQATADAAIGAGSVTVSGGWSDVTLTFPMANPQPSTYGRGLYIGANTLTKAAVPVADPTVTNTIPGHTANAVVAGPYGAALAGKATATGLSDYPTVFDVASSAWNERGYVKWKWGELEVNDLMGFGPGDYLDVQRGAGYDKVPDDPAAIRNAHSNVQAYSDTFAEYLQLYLHVEIGRDGTNRSGHLRLHNDLNDAAQIPVIALETNDTYTQARLKAIPAQTAPLLVLTDESGNDVFTVAPLGAMSMLEQADPAAPAANIGTLYARDNGSGKTQLCVRFSSGAVQVLATQP